MGVLLGSGLTDPEKVGLTVTIESFVPTLAPILDGDPSPTIAPESATKSSGSLPGGGTSVAARMETGRYPHMAGLSEHAMPARLERGDLRVRARPS